MEDCAWKLEPNAVKLTLMDDLFFPPPSLNIAGNSKELTHNLSASFLFL